MSEMRSHADSSPVVWTSRPTDPEIAGRAYDLWVAAGRPEGRDKEHWLEAEAQFSSMWQLAERFSAGLPFVSSTALTGRTEAQSPRMSD